MEFWNFFFVAESNIGGLVKSRIIFRGDRVRQRSDHRVVQYQVAEREEHCASVSDFLRFPL